MLEDAQEFARQAVQRHKISFMLGILIGFFLVWYLRLDEPGGIILVLALSAIFFTSVGALLARFKRSE